MQEMKETTKSYEQSLEEFPSNGYFLATVGSIGLASSLFLLGKKDLAFFIGLWTPTILLTGLFFKLLRPHRMR
ncbi:MAG: hypothetical protein HYY30_05835 [Chloroflexi bacterium]|nr:hypothetical protein [Chloroflexota bacterium]